jgi:hypothetical protein
VVARPARRRPARCADDHPGALIQEEHDMSDTRNDASDIAWLKGLAEEGSKAPIRGGSILFAAGMIYGSGSLAHWAVAMGIIPADESAYNIIWGSTLATFFVALLLLIGRLKRQGGVETAANRAFSIVWSALGWGIFSLFLALVAGDLSRGGQSDMTDWSLVIPSIIMAFYGVGWAVTATMVRSRSLWWLAVAAFAAAPGLAVMSGTPWQYLAYAAGLFGLMALPGFLIMRASKA